MNPNYLEFEQPIAELDAKIESLRAGTGERDIDITEELRRLEAKSRKLTDSVFAWLTPWQIAQPAATVHARLREPDIDGLRRAER